MQEILESQRTCEKRLLQYKRDHNELVELHGGEELMEVQFSKRL